MSSAQNIIKLFLGTLPQHFHTMKDGAIAGSDDNCVVRWAWHKDTCSSPGWPVMFLRQLQSTHEAQRHSSSAFDIRGLHPVWLGWPCSRWSDLTPGRRLLMFQKGERSCPRVSPLCKLHLSKQPGIYKGYLVSHWRHLAGWTLWRHNPARNTPSDISNWKLDNKMTISQPDIVKSHSYGNLVNHWPPGLNVLAGTQYLQCHYHIIACWLVCMISSRKSLPRRTVSFHLRGCNYGQKCNTLQVCALGIIGNTSQQLRQKGILLPSTI